MRQTLSALVLPVAMVTILSVGPFASAEKTCCPKAAAAKTLELFNGKCLGGWQCHNVENKPMEEVWSVKDGILETTGQPFGYLYTKKSYTNYKLVVEWRWKPGVDPSNCGVLLRMADKPISFLTTCVEAQLKQGSVGDIWGFYGAKCEGAEDRMRVIKDHKLLGDFSGVGKIKDAEKEPGEWNTYEITLNQGDLSIVLNGEKVNEATGLEVKAGPIGVQSEGGPIQFRKIELTPICK